MTETSLFASKLSSDVQSIYAGSGLMTWDAYKMHVLQHFRRGAERGSHGAGALQNGKYVRGCGGI